MDYDTLEQTLGKAASVYADLSDNRPALTGADSTPDWFQLVRIQKLANTKGTLEAAVELPLLQALLQIRRGNRERARELLLEVIGQALRGYEWIVKEGVENK